MNNNNSSSDRTSDVVDLFLNLNQNEHRVLEVLAGSLAQNWHSEFNTLEAEPEESRVPILAT